MSKRIQAFVGYGVAAAALIALAGPAPQAAISMAAVIGLGIALTHADEISQLLGTFTSAVGG